MRKENLLGRTEPFLHQLVAVLDRERGDAYPEVRRNRETIEKTILAEEQRLHAVWRDGCPRLEAEIVKVLGTRSKTLPGEAAFKLYDTFGVPYDFIEDTAATQGVTVDKAGYEAAMETQRGKGRVQNAFGEVKKGEDAFVWMTRAEIGEQLSSVAPDHFVGYETTK